MSSAFDMLLYGFSLAFQPENLIFALIGSVLGTFVGVLPGLGPVATIAVLLPLTYQAGSPLGSIIMLSAIYYGAMYGGSTTSILMRLPGEAASVITCLDGYEMAKQGRAGPALAIAAIGSFVAGTVAIVGLTFVGPAFANAAVDFGPPEMFSLALLGVVLCASLSGGPPLRGIAMALAGILLGLVGVDLMTGVERLSMGSINLTGGIELVPMLMGLFGLGEVFHNLSKQDGATLLTTKIGKLMPTRRDWRESIPAIGRGSVVGFLIGLLPGGGAILGSLLSYTMEKRVSAHPERFGKGAIAGVAGPESANNAAATSSFVPLLTLGLPGNAVTAVLFAGLLIQNIQPGPMMLVQHADIFWGVIASMYVGNMMLLVLNLPLVGLWVQLLRVPFWLLAPAIVMVSVFGTYSLRNNWFDVGVLLVSGGVGYLFRAAAYEAAPMAMAFILADILDTSLRQALLMSDHSLGIFFTRPRSGVILAIAAVVVVSQLYSYHRRHRRTS
ncbi:MAG: tripartite tricarboxylate transporter permease [Burkholderiales bacterium]|nr:tripartite tricarboxylate transporter permease [Burkholderiales bacterium]